MKLTRLLNDLHLEQAPSPTLRLPDAREVAHHFHLTEIGLETRDFLDCGGTRRQRTRAVLQVLVAGDTEHRLGTGKLAGILETAIRQRPELKEAEVEIELTGDQTIERYGVETIGFGLVLQLQSLATACLAPDTCSLDSTEAAASRPAAACANSSCC